MTNAAVLRMHIISACAVQSVVCKLAIVVSSWHRRCRPAEVSVCIRGWPCESKCAVLYCENVYLCWGNLVGILLPYNAPIRPSQCQSINHSLFT